MTCDEWRIFLQDYVDGALSDPARGAIDRHLSECAACFADARAHKFVETRLAAQPMLGVPAGLIDRAMKKLPIPAIGSWKRELARLAAAALLLIGVGGVIYTGFRSRIPKVETPPLAAPFEETGHNFEKLMQKAGY